MKGISGRSSVLDDVAIDMRDPEGSLSVVVDEDGLCKGALSKYQKQMVIRRHPTHPSALRWTRKLPIVAVF